jgi:hypothetical protein
MYFPITALFEICGGLRRFLLYNRPQACGFSLFDPAGKVKKIRLSLQEFYLAEECAARGMGRGIGAAPQKRPHLLIESTVSPDYEYRIS